MKKLAIALAIVASATLSLSATAAASVSELSVTVQSTPATTVAKNAKLVFFPDMTLSATKRGGRVRI